MVDIVQSNETKLLIRKIGYSVGLESTLARFKQLIDVYVAESQLSDPTWRKLVTEGFRRELPARKHFENLFAVLGIFIVSNGRPVAQPILDAGALLKKFYADDAPAFERAIRAVLLYSITLADGELFGALLSTGFDRRQYEHHLAEFRKRKLLIFYERYRNKFDREKLHQTIDFQEVASSSDGKAIHRATAGPFAQARSATKSKDVEDFSVSLSTDWFKKVPARREAWAQDLGLYSEGKETEGGRRYIDALRSLLPADHTAPNSPVILMPLDAEMRSRHVTWALDDELLVTHDRFLNAIAAAYVPRNSPQRSQQQLDLEDMAKQALEYFMKADTRFQMLRRELPYIVFSLLVLGVCVSSGINVGGLKTDLEDLAMEKRNILLRPSRVSVFGISFSRH